MTPLRALCAEPLDSHRAFNLVVAALLLTFLIAPLVVTASDLDRLGVTCAVRARTGQECPSCGISRSVLALYHDGLASSRELHPMGIVLVIAGAFQLALRVPVHINARRFRWVALADLLQLVVLGSALALRLGGSFT